MKQDLKCPRCDRYLGKAPVYREEASGETMMLKCGGCKDWVDVPVPVARTVKVA